MTKREVSRALRAALEAMNDEEAVRTIWHFNDDALTNWGRMRQMSDKAASEPLLPKRQPTNKA